MAKIANTAFEVVVSNAKRNETQNITGKFGSFDGETFIADACSAGFICELHSRLPLEGYTEFGFKNKNSWYVVAATDGIIAGQPGDHTGLYACNTYDVQKVNVAGMAVNIPGKTLGLPVPADERGDFTELLVGETYAFGAGNFSTLPTTTNKYCTVSNGRLVGSSSAPTTGAVYFELVEIARFTEGARDGGAKYILKALRSVAA